MLKQSGSEVGTGGLEGGLSPYSFQKCFDLCRSRPDECKSMQYSPDRQQCKLLAHQEPASSTTHQDFVWCTIGV